MKLGLDLGKVSLFDEVLLTIKTSIEKVKSILDAKHFYVIIFMIYLRNEDGRK